MPVLESRLVIKAFDETGKAFAEVEKRIASLEKAALSVEKVMSSLGKVTSEAGLFAGVAQREDMDAAISKMERLIRVTEEAAKAQKTLAQSARGAAGALEGEGSVGEAGMRRVSRGTRGATRVVASGKGGGEHGNGLFKGLVEMEASEKIVEAGKKAIEGAADLEQLRFRIRELSRKDPSEAELADRLAGNVALKYPSITMAKALDTYIELRANSVDASGRIDPAVAERNLMAGARAQNAAGALGIDMTPEDLQNLLKGVEGSGRANDPKAVTKITDAYLRAKQIFGTAIAASMIRDYTANAKSSNFSIGEDQFYLSNLVSMSEGNASRLGNEVNQTLATMVGGHMTKGTGAWMVAHGLARADQIVKTGPGSVLVKGGLKDEATLSTNQKLWANTTLRKAIEDSGAISDDKIAARAAILRADMLRSNPNEPVDEHFLREHAEEGLISAEIAKTGMRTSVTDRLAHFIGNNRLIERDTSAMLNASGLDAGERISQNSSAAFKEMTSAASNFADMAASPAVKAAGPVLDRLARELAKVSHSLLDFEKAHPQAATAGSFGALAAGAATAGWLGWKAWGAVSGLFGGGGSGAAVGGAGGAATGAGALGWGGVGALAPMAGVAAGGGVAYSLYEWLKNYHDPGVSDFDLERSRRSGQVAHPGGFVYDPEAHHGAALSGLGEQHGPIQVDSTVHGEATITGRFVVEAGSELLSIVNKALNISQQVALNPVATGHAGAMNSDAAPAHVGGIGHM